jgi:hypothetical protein
MMTFLASVLVIALALVGMAAGVLLGRRPITGSCGGLNRSGLGIACLFCSKPCSKKARTSGDARPGEGSNQ